MNSTNGVKLELMKKQLLEQGFDVMHKGGTLLVNMKWTIKMEDEGIRYLVTDVDTQETKKYVLGAAVRAFFREQEEQQEKGMKNMEQTYGVLYQFDYPISFTAYSVMGDMVEVIGEAMVEMEDGRILEQFIYYIYGHKSENGKPFAALKANITVPQK